MSGAPNGESPQISPSAPNGPVAPVAAVRGALRVGHGFVTTARAKDPRGTLRRLGSYFGAFRAALTFVGVSIAARAQDATARPLRAYRDALHRLLRAQPGRRADESPHE